MLECRERGINLTGIAVMTQKCDSGIVSLKEAGITRPRELEGKRLTHWTPAWFHAAIRRVVEADGGDYDKINLVNLDVGDIVATLGLSLIHICSLWRRSRSVSAGQREPIFSRRILCW